MHAAVISFLRPEGNHVLEELSLWQEFYCFIFLTSNIQRGYCNGNVQLMISLCPLCYQLDGNSDGEPGVLMTAQTITSESLCTTTTTHITKVHTRTFSSFSPMQYDITSPLPWWTSNKILPWHLCMRCHGALLQCLYFPVSMRSFVSLCLDVFLIFLTYLLWQC